MSFDTQQYIELFFQEAEEHIELMTESLLDLERNTSDKEALGALFRAAHTIKSSSAMVGFMHISEFTHKMEDLIGYLRDNDIEIDSNTVDLLFNAFDLLKDMMGQLQDKDTEASRNELKHKSDALIARFQKILHGESAADEEKPEEEKATPQAVLPRIHMDAETRTKVEEIRLSGEKIYEITVQFNKDAEMVSTRAFLVINNLSQVGMVLKTEPDLDDESQAFDNCFAILYSSQFNMDKVKKLCEVSEVENVIIEDATQAEQFEWPEEEKTGEQEIATESETEEEKESGAATVEKETTTSFDRREDRSLSQTVRVNIEKLDRLLNLAAEMVIQRGRSHELCRRLVEQTKKGGLEEEILDSIVQQGMFLSQLQETIMESRMIPIGMVFSRFRRVVRDLARTREKKINLRHRRRGDRTG